MPSLNIEDPVYQATEHYSQLVRQNQDFVMRLTAALESGAETAAGVTATVRTRSEAKKRSSPKAFRIVN